MLKPRGQTGLEVKHLASASASRHSGRGLKVLASASNQNITSCSISLLIYLLIKCYTQAFIIKCSETTAVDDIALFVVLYDDSDNDC